MLPDFVIIGAMKSGTTSLYHYLASMPGMVPSAKKETDYFTSTAEFSMGRAWYESQFMGDGHYAIEASPNYTKRHLFAGVPERMYSTLPEAKLIYVLRDPIERAISHYMHNVAHGRETKAFSKVIVNPGSNYIQTSRYYYQLLAFREYYPDERIMLVQSEELLRNPSEVVSKVCSFLQVPFRNNEAAFAKRFQVSTEKTRPWGLEHLLSRCVNNEQAARIIRRVGRRLPRRKIGKPVLRESDEQLLERMLRPDVEELRGYSGYAFAGWRL